MSAQCMALVRDDCLVPTKDAPELGFVRESSEKQYVPDVFYKVSSIEKLFFCVFVAFPLFFVSFSIVSIQLHHFRRNFLLFSVDPIPTFLRLWSLLRDGKVSPTSSCGSSPAPRFLGKLSHHEKSVS